MTRAAHRGGGALAWCQRQAAGTGAAACLPGPRGDGPHLPWASPSQALGHKVPARNGREPGEMTRTRRRRTKTRRSPRLPQADGPLTPGAAVTHGPSPALLHGWGWAFPLGRVQRRGRDWKPPHRLCLSWGTPAPLPGSPHSELFSWSASAAAGSHGGTDAVLLAPHSLLTCLVVWQQLDGQGGISRARSRWAHGGPVTARSQERPRASGGPSESQAQLCGVNQ